MYLVGVKGNPLVTKADYATARENGISERTVRYRLRKGYTKEQAINEPSYKRVLDRRK